MNRLLTAACLALLASPALAERPADVLARLRGTPSTSAGPLGSDFPQQYVDAYRWAGPPVVVYPGPGYATCSRPPGTIVRVGIDAGPVTIGGVYTTGSFGVVRCPAAGFGTTTTTVTTTTTTVTTSGSGVVILALPLPAPAPAPTRRVLAARP